MKEGSAGERILQRAAAQLAVLRILLETPALLYDEKEMPDTTLAIEVRLIFEQVLTIVSILERVPEELSESEEALSTIPSVLDKAVDSVPELRERWVKNKLTTEDVLEVVRKLEATFKEWADDD